MVTALLMTGFRRLTTNCFLFLDKLSVGPNVFDYGRPNSSAYGAPAILIKVDNYLRLTV